MAGTDAPPSPLDVLADELADVARRLEKIETDDPARVAKALPLVDAALSALEH